MSSKRTDEAFLAELTALLIKEGVSGLTIGALAERLQCSRRRLYSIAATKEEIFLLVCRRVLDQNLARGFKAAEGAPDAALAIAAYLRATLNSSGLSRVALIDLDSTEAGRRVFDAYQYARVHGLETMIEEGARQGVLAAHNPRLVSEAILGAAHRLRNQQFLQDTGLTIGDAFNEFYSLILDGLLVKKKDA